MCILDPELVADYYDVSSTDPPPNLDFMKDSVPMINHGMNTALLTRREIITKLKT